MIIIIGSKIGKQDIKESLGKPEYSYYFLLKEFLPALEAIGTVIVAKDIQEINQHYATHHAEGKQVVFLSFAPPHQTPLNLQCPTIPVFAWEFDSMPSTAWENDPRNDWRYVFSKVAGTITTSQETCTLINTLMHTRLPVMALPTPIWNKYAPRSLTHMHQPELGHRAVDFSGTVIDSPLLGLSADGLVSKAPPTEGEAAQTPIETPNKSASQQSIWTLAKQLYEQWWSEFSLPRYTGEVSAANLKQQLALSGVVYTTVLNPADGRKNWIDLITAFCWAFKNTEDATLVVKMTHHDLDHYRVVLMTLLSRLSPFQCRVVVLHAYLDDQQYRQLVDASTYYVNASFCEGLCIPLLEFLSSAKPAIAPDHTAMADYISSDCAFVLEHSLEPTCWSHDPAGMLLTHRHRISWQSLEAAYRKSYLLAKEQPAAYARMSENATATMKKYSAVDTVSQRLHAFLQTVLAENAARSERELAQ